MSEVFARVINSSDNRMYPWFLSRPKGTDITNITQLNKIDMSLHDFYKITVHYRASSGFRELLSGLVGYAMWSQSTRNTGIEFLEIPSYLSESYYYKALDMCQSAVDESNNTHQDVGRMLLPLATICEFTYQTDIRTLVGIHKSLKKYNLDRYLDNYSTPIFEQLGLNPDELLGKPIDEFYTIPEDSKLGSTELNGMRLVTADLPIGLRAQLVRHKSVLINDDIWTKLVKLGIDEFETLSLNDTLRVNISLPESSYKEIASKRSCFISQSELWWSFIKPKVDEVGYKNILPCKGCKSNCKFVGEAEDCEKGLARTLPCPIYSGVEHYVARVNYIGKDNQFIKDTYEEYISDTKSL